MTFAVSSIPPSLTLPAAGPHRLAGYVCLHIGKQCCGHFTTEACIRALRGEGFTREETMEALRVAKRHIRGEQRQTRGNPYR